MTINPNSPKPGAARRVPQRTCIACRQVKGKREFVRLVRTPQGDIEIDAAGKQEGRGAYICPDEACLKKALQDKHLERVFKRRLTEADWEQLIERGRELVKERIG